MANGQLTKVVRHLRRMLGAPGAGDLTDRQLLERFTAGRDEEAFATLVTRHAPLVLGVCRRILGNEQDAEDAFQAAFLVLARKAGSVGWHESVGNWLYSVAYHLASRLRLQSARRRKHEREAATMQAGNAGDSVDWQQLGRVLDEELHRLPEKYRMPLLLCYLHGKTRDEAAEQLGWTLGEIKGRLERGRDLLRDRLARRGLTLSAALLPTVLAEGQLTAAPASLLTSTVQAAVTGAVAAPVAALLKEGVQAMFWAKAKFVAAVLLTVGIIGSGASYWTWQATSQPLATATPAESEGGRTQDHQEIPLEDIWATNMPGTKAMDSYRSGKPDFLYRAPEGPLVAEIDNVLRNTANAPLEGFAVAGRDMAALKEAHRVLTEDLAERFNDRAPKTTLLGRAVTFPRGQPLSLVISLYVAAGHAHIQKVTRTGTTFSINCNFVPGERLTLHDKVQLALIPLGQMTPGKYRVEINGRVAPQQASALDEESRKKWEEHLASRVCRWFEFTVAAGASAEETKPPQPAVKDGLSVTVTPAKAVFAGEEAIMMNVVFKNVSQRPFKLWGVRKGWTWRLENLQDRTIWKNATLVGSQAPEVPENRPTVEAGQEFHVEALSAIEFYQDKAGEKRAGVVGEQGNVRCLPPGRYRAILSYSSGSAGGWTGAIAANPVEFEIAADKAGDGAKASEPAVKDGLSIAVTPAKPKFAYKEPLQFTIVFKNTSTEAFSLLASDHPEGWKIYFERVEGDVGFWVEQGADKAADKKVQRLEPGKALAVVVKLGKVNFRVKRLVPPKAPDGMPLLLGSVIPGRYRVTFTKEFQAGDDKGPRRWWAGEITSQPVEIEIAAGTPDGAVYFDRAKQPAGTLEIAIVANKLGADDGAAKRKSFKGWELYAQFDDQNKEWRFRLLQGTNRLKTAQEIADAQTIVGVQKLKEELSGLATGEEILLQNAVSAEIRKVIEDHCAKERLQFEQAPAK